MLLLLSSATGATADTRCVDEGPWPCSVDGCPSETVGCSSLAELDLCSSQFAEIWNPPPFGLSGTVHGRCPRACGRCGVDPPAECNMAVIDGTALGEEALAAALVAAEEPVVIRPVPHSWAAPPLERLVRDHGELPLSVTLSGGRFIGDEAESAPSSLGRYSLELASGQLPADAYVFDELGGVDLSSGEFALGGTGLVPACTAAPEQPSRLSTEPSCRHGGRARRPRSLGGRAVAQLLQDGPCAPQRGAAEHCRPAPPLGGRLGERAPLPRAWAGALRAARRRQALARAAAERQLRVAVARGAAGEPVGRIAAGRLGAARVAVHAARGGAPVGTGPAAPRDPQLRRGHSRRHDGH